jgi:hypothetical protein
VDIPDFFLKKKPDVNRLARQGDITGLIRALKYRDPDIQWQVSHALAEIGHERIGEIISALRHKNKHVRLGVISALGELRDPEAVSSLIESLGDRHDEIRWEAAIALGEIGDPLAIPPLCTMLRDDNKYVRHGAATALEKLRWDPAGPEDRAYYYLASFNWLALGSMGEAALPVLEFGLADPDPGVRRLAVDTLGTIQTTKSVPALMTALGDPDEEVRWLAVRSAPVSGLEMKFIPRALAKRPRKRKNPYIAGFLNFVLPGMGYFYLGLWWGILLFQVDLTLTLWMYSYQGQQLSFGVLLPVYFVLAFHAWYIGKNLPDFS